MSAALLLAAILSVVLRLVAYLGKRARTPTSPALLERGLARCAGSSTTRAHHVRGDVRRSSVAIRVVGAWHRLHLRIDRLVVDVFNLIGFTNIPIRMLAVSRPIRSWSDPAFHLHGSVARRWARRATC
jgi:hypothetical protein